VDLLRTRRQVILNGLPGTGKSFPALEVASALTDPANVTLVPFHPAGFYEGYRPAPSDDGQEFSLPMNVYLVGTMNTADRSIALVDAAMRRWFAFLSLDPDDAHLRGVLRAWLEPEGLPMVAADLLEALNARISDRDFTVGPSYLMRRNEAGTEAGLERIRRTVILPLLEELHYPDGFPDAGLYQMLAHCAAPQLPVGRLVYAKGNEAARRHQFARRIHHPIRRARGREPASGSYAWLTETPWSRPCNPWPGTSTSRTSSRRRSRTAAPQNPPRART
jgi:hypothetical protein